MAAMLPVAVYSLKVPAGDVMIPATLDFPATFRITMAAIDPSAEIEEPSGSSANQPRATLKMVYDPSGPDSEDSEVDSDEEDEYLQALLDGEESDGLSDEADEDEEDDDEEDEEDEAEGNNTKSKKNAVKVNGTDAKKPLSKKARKEAATRELMEALASQEGEEDSEDDEMEVDPALKAAASKKSKKSKDKATVDAEGEVESDSDDEDIDSDEDEIDGMEEVVVCTLDPQRTYQQPIDITIPEDQPTYFKVSGTHAVYLTGNYVVPQDAGPEGDDYDEDDYDLSPDDDEIDSDEEDEDGDHLDDLDDPRVVEVDSEEDDEDDEDDGKVPALVTKAASSKKGKNKRAAADSISDEEEDKDLDAMITDSIKGTQKSASTEAEPKLSKKQLKKMKNNAGSAVETTADGKTTSKDSKVNDSKNDKKVQFAKNIEQGPTGSPATTDAKKESASANDKSKTQGSLGVKTVQGVTIDDKKLGKGAAAKKGDRLGMRYIGKLKNGKVFDANKKGPPFRFKLGSGQVIKGWDIGVAGMSVEGERRITIPAHLGYGSKGTPGIPGNSELIFDIKLLEIN